MLSRMALPFMIVVGALASPLSAQSGQGTYTTVSIASDTIPMPDGATHVLGHYRQVMLASSPTFPTHNTMGDCAGLIRIVDGKPAAASGSCFGQSMDGHGYTLWWQMTEAGTSACPDLCGNWGVYGGYGRFAGLSVMGTWKRSGQFFDGSSSGTWTGSATTR